MRDGVSVVGKWERAVAPLTDKLELPGKVGCEVTLSAEYAVAMAQSITLMARLIDLQEASDRLGKQLRNSVIAAFVVVGIYVALVVTFA